jgi:rhodanese-related sulfurtransferase
MPTTLAFEPARIAKPGSNVLAHPAADRETALAHLRRKLSLEVDPADVHADLERGERGFVVLDARSPELYAEAHVPGAINLPHRLISPETAALLPRDKVIVTYCDGVGCNASTRAALKLADLGFAVKEMVGGIDWWRRDGHPVHSSGRTEGEPVSPVRCGC